MYINSELIKYFYFVFCYSFDILKIIIHFPSFHLELKEHGKKLDLPVALKIRYVSKEHLKEENSS
jgi:hypothetical protein